MKNKCGSKEEMLEIDGLTLRVIRSARRTVCMRVGADGVMEVLAPFPAAIGVLPGIVRPHLGRLLELQTKKVEQIGKKAAFRLNIGDRLCFLGGTRTVAESDLKAMTYDDISFYVPTGLSCDEIRSSIVKIYKKAAKDFIGCRVSYYAPIIGCEVKGIRINSASSQFASCSRKNTLNFSWHCIMAPCGDIDYIVIHELCHMHHFDHSKRFWELVEQYCPDYKIHKSNLKTLSDKIACEDWGKDG